MNAPVLLAQLSGSPAQSPASPKNLKIEKPQNGQAITVHLDGATRLDLAGIASERLTFVRVGEKLVILFDNQSTVTVDPVFDNNGRPVTDLAFDMGADRTLSSEQFAQAFPITTDQSVLPAAGGATGPTGGASFSDASVGALGGSGARLDLLAGEDGANGFGSDQDRTGNATPNAGGITAVILNEDGFSEGNRGGSGDAGGIATSVTGTLNVNFGTDSVGRSFSFAPSQPALQNLSSGGEAVQLAFVNIGGVPTLIGYVGADFNTAANQVFTITLNVSDTGDTYTFTLLRPLDHSLHGTIEETLSLTINVIAADGSSDATPITLQIGINDDTPTIGTVGQSTLTDPLIGAPSAQTGSLGISWGADRFNTAVDGGVSTGNGDRSVVFSSANVVVTGAAGGVASSIAALTSHGETVQYVLLGNGSVLVAYTGATAPTSLADALASATASQGSEGQSGGNIVFIVTLSDASNTGSYTVTQYRSLDHDNGQATFETIDLAFNFTATDSDGDPVSSTLHVVVNDTVPVITGPVDSSVLGEAIGNQEGPGSEMPARLAVSSDGAFVPSNSGDVSLNIDWRSDNQNPTHGGGAHDRSVAFASAMQTNLEALHLTSDGAQIRYEISADGTLLTAYVQIGEGSEATTRPVFTVQLSDDGNGSYNFALLDNIDHAPGNGKNSLSLTFSFVATDSDGDTASSSFDVTIVDDAPTIGVPQGAQADESAFGNAPVSVISNTDVDTDASDRTVGGTLNITWGADDANINGNAGITGSPVNGDRAVTFDQSNKTALLALGLTHNNAALSYEISADGLTLTAKANGEEIFNVRLSDEGHGSYVFTLTRNIDHAANSDSLNLSFAFTATDGDGDTASSNFSVTVVDDAPTIGKPASAQADESAFGNGPVSLISDTDVDTDLATRTVGGKLGISWGADDGNNGGNVGITGAPVNGDRAVTFDQSNKAALLALGLTHNNAALSYEISADGLTLTAKANGEEIFNVKLSDEGSGSYVFTLTRNIDHAVNSNSLNLSFAFTATDSDGDTASASFAVTVLDDTPSIGKPASAQADESAFGNGPVSVISDVEVGTDSNTRTVGGKLGISWGADDGNNGGNVGITGSPVTGDRAVTFDQSNKSALLALGLTHNNAALSYEISADGLTLTAKANGEEIFTVKLSDEGSGSYIFTLTRNIDHATNSNSLDLSFAFTATDSDGDAASSSFTVTVVDDAPTITQPASAQADESAFGNGPVSVVTDSGVDTDSNTRTVGGKLGISWGADDANNGGNVGIAGSTVTGDRAVTFDQSNKTALLALGLTHNGAALSYEISANGLTLTAKANGEEIFSVNLSDEGSGSYIFTLTRNIDHAANSNSLDLSFTFTATDSDGDTAGSSFMVKVLDDAPTITSPASAQADESAFGNGPVSVVTDSGIDMDANARTVGGKLGISWGADDANNGGNVGITGPTVTGDRAVTFDQSNKASLLALGLKHNGAALSYEISADGLTLTAKANGEEIFSVKLSDEGSGSYIFTLTRNIDHAANSNSLDLSFAFTATDSDGDTAGSSFTVKVLDDGPVIGNPASAQADESAFGNGPVSVITDSEIDTDSNARTVGGKLGISWGADDANNGGNVGITGSAVAGDRAVTFDQSNKAALLALGLTHNNVALSYDISADGLTLTAKANGEEIFNVKLSDQGSGSYIFTLTRSIDHAPNSDSRDLNFAFTATDSDGDTASSSFSVKVLDDAPTIGTPASSRVDEDDLAAGNHDGLAPITDTTIDTDSSKLTVGGKLGISWGADDGNNSVNGGINGTPVHGDRAVTFDQSTIDALTAQNLKQAGVGLSYEVASNGTVLLAKAGGQEVFRVTLSDKDDGSYVFKLSGKLDHPDTSSEDSLDLTFRFTATDSDGDTATSSFKVTVNDDAPTAAGESATVAESAPSQSTGNIILAFDRSGSMGDDPDGQGGYSSRLALAKAAAINLLNASGADQVLIVTFSDSATVSNWMTKAQAIAFINGGTFPGTNGGTDYDNATSAIMNATIPSGAAAVYFFSDGQPTNNGGLSNSERAAWDNFLQGKGMTSYAVGVGGSISGSDPDLNDIAYPGSPLIISTANDPALLGTVSPAIPTSASGNVLSNDSFGADGGRILSITVGGVTYTWNGASSIATSNGSTIAGSALTVTTGINGVLTFNFSTGAWSYNAPSQLVTNATETFSYKLIDGDGDTAGANLVINVTAVNDAPVNSVPNPLSVDEDQPIVFSSANQNAISISDVDHNGGNETVKLSVLHGTLTLSGTTNLVVSGNGTGQVMVTGTVDAINAALNGLKYQPSNDYNGSDTLTVVTNDNGNNGIGGAKSDTDTIAITIKPVNDAPVLAPDTNEISYTENASAVKLMANATVTDPDTPANFDGGSVTVSLGSSAVSGDQLIFASNSGVTLSGNNVRVNNTTIGTVSGYGTSTMTITFDDDATNAVVQTVLRALAYQSSSDNPTAADRTVTVTFNDGANDGSGPALSDTSTITIHVTPVNDAPVNAAPGSASVNEDTAIVFSSNNGNAISISDIDANSGNETVKLSVLHGTLTLSGTSGLTVSGDGTGTVTVTGSIAAINAALNGLKYQPANNYNGSDTLTVVTNDNGNSGTGGAKSDTDTIAITIKPMNDAPVLAPDSNEISYTENASAVKLMPNATVTDPDNPSNFSGGSVTVSLGTSAVSGDQIVFAGNSGVTVVANVIWVGFTAVGTVSGLNSTNVTISFGLGATDSNVETVLRALAYQSSSENPTAADRTVTVTFNDGGNDGGGSALSDTSTIIVHVTPVNDAPVASNDSGSATEKGGTANGSGGSNATGNVLSNDSDVDNPQSSLLVSGIRVGTSGTVGTVGTALVGDHGTLTLNADGSYSYVINQSDSVVQALNVGNTTTDTFTYTVRDPSGATDTAQLTITINGANDAPVAFDDAGSATEKGGVSNGSGGSTATGNVRANDSDVDNTTSSLAISAVRTGTEAGSGTSGTIGSSLNGLYGALKLNADGSYTYTVNESNGSVQALNVGDTLTETFTYTVRDSGGLTDTAQLVITINGANDAAVIGGDLLGSVKEAGGVANATVGTPTATGTATVTDVDSAATFVVQSGVTTTYGTFSIGTNGAWTYNLNNANSSVQALNAGGTLHDLITITSADGTSKQIDITINGTNDAAIVSSASVNLTETNTAASISASGSLTISDVDSPATFVAQTNVAGLYGKFSINAAGAWTYTSNSAHDEFQAGQTYVDSFAVSAADGTLTTVVINIAGTNDAPVLVVTNGTNGNIGDGFESGNYSGSTGTPNLWTTNWVEVGESTSSNSGDIQIRTVSSNSYVRLGDSDGSNTSIQRTVDLSGTASATLSFKYQRVGLDDSDDRVFVQVSTDGVNFTQIAVIGGGTFNDSGFLSSSIDLSAYRSSTTTIRFVASSGLDTNDYVYLDDVNIAYTREPTFTENGSAVAIVSDVSLSDADNANMASATVALTNKQAGDQLLINNTVLSNGSTGVIGGVSYSVTETADAITITFSGSATKAAYEAAVEAVKYASSSENPSTVDRTFQIVVNDGNDNSNTGTAVVHVVAVNDAPVAANDTAAAIEKGGVANGTAGSDATGNVLTNDTDAETPATLVVSAIRTGTEAGTGNAGTVGLSLAGAYGSLTLNANGTYSYVINDSNATVQALNVGGTLTETFTYTVKDPGGLTDTAQLVITINGANDAAVISGTISGSVTEAGGVNNAVTGTQTATGTLTDTDVDNPANTFQAVSTATGTTNGYGTYTMTAGGVWTFTLNNANATVQALNVGQTLTETFTVKTIDGTSQVVTVTINGANDAAVISGTATGSVTEAGGVNNAVTGTPTATGTLTDTDVDNLANAFQAVSAATSTANGYGTYTMTGDGVWTFTLNNANVTVQALIVGQTLTDTFTVKSVDGTSQVVTVTINGANDTAVISGTITGAVTEDVTLSATGSLTVADPDAGQSSFQAVTVATASIGGLGTYTVTAAGVWTYNVNNSSSAVQSLGAGQSTTDTFKVKSFDGTEQVVTVTIHGTNDAPTLSVSVPSVSYTDTAADDSFTAVTGTLSSADPDSGDTKVFRVNGGESSSVHSDYDMAVTRAYGVLYLSTTSGKYLFEPNDAYIEALGPGGASYTYTFFVKDGSNAEASQNFTVFLTGANDTPTFTGSALAEISETNAIQTTGGALVVSDRDSGQSFFVAQTDIAGTSGYGTFTIDANGVWSYKMNSAHDEFVAGQTYTDTLTVKTIDNTTQVLTVKITGTNDAPVLTGDRAATVAEGGTYTIVATDLGFSDPDDIASGVTFTASSLSSGIIQVNGVTGNSFTGTQLAAGQVKFIHNGGESAVASFQVSVEDGNEDNSTPPSQIFTFSVTPVNDGAASITVSDTTQTATAPKIGDILQANLGADPDGAPSNVVYHWQSDGANIAGATGATYTLAAGDAGHKISVNVTYTDGQGFSENVTSGQTATVISGNHAPVAVNDTLSFGSSVGTAPTGAGWVYNAQNGHYYKFVAGSITFDQAVAGAAAQAQGAYLLTVTSAAEQSFVLGSFSSLTTGQLIWLGASDAASEGTFVWVTGPEAGTVVSGYTPWGPGEPNNWDGDEDYLSINRFSGSNFNTPLWNDSGTSLGGDSSGYIVEWGGLGSGPGVSEDVVTTFNKSLLLANDTDADGDTLSITSVSASSAKGAVVTYNSATGQISYDPTNAATIQALGAGATTTDTFTYTINDGHGGTSTATATITINGANDAAVISGVKIGAVTEAVTGGSAGTPTATGDLNSTDIDGTADAWTVVSTATVTANGYGSYTIDATGHWSYQLNNSNAAVNALNNGQSLTDTFTVSTADGTKQVVTITINGATDPSLPATASAYNYGQGSNNSTSNAYDITGLNYVKSSDPDVTNASTSPSITISAKTTNGEYDYYKFVISQSGTTVTFDIDNTSANFDTWIRIRNSANNSTIAQNDQSTAIDSGSFSVDDSYLSATLNAGTYYLQVGRYNGSNGQFSTFNNSSATYELQVSIIPPGGDPIIFDLGNDGIAFSSLHDGVQFDVNGDGIADRTAWITGNDGILAVDLDGSGKIESGKEIFAPNFNGGNFADGLSALATFDSNHDGKIDASDTDFGKLVIWQDANHNGITDPGELKTLTEWGITSIALAAAPADGTHSGQQLLAQGTYTYADGSTGHFIEVDLEKTISATPTPVIALVEASAMTDADFVGLAGIDKLQLGDFANSVTLGAQAEAAANSTLTIDGTAATLSAHALIVDGSAVSAATHLDIFGGAASDVLSGGHGDDILAGGLGNDTLTGGAGADRFTFAEMGHDNMDTILDYNAGQSDVIDISALLGSLTGAAADGSNIDRYVHLEQNNNNIVVQVDTAGTGNFSGGSHDVALLQGYGTSNADIVRIAFQGHEHQLTA